MPTRKKVYAAISEELDSKYTFFDTGEERRIGEYIALMDYCLAMAKTHHAQSSTSIHCLQELRRTAALAVRCMEEWGLPVTTTEDQTEERACERR